MTWNQLQDFISEMSEGQKNGPILVVTDDEVIEVHDLCQAGLEIIRPRAPLAVPTSFFYLT